MNIDLKNVSQPRGTPTKGESQGAGSPSPVGSNVQGASSTPGSSSSSSTTSDSVSLTPGGQQLAQLQTSLASQPSVNQQRVDQLRQAIQNGQYQIDPLRTASKLISFEATQGKRG